MTHALKNQNIIQIIAWCIIILLNTTNKASLSVSHIRVVRCDSKYTGISMGGPTVNQRCNCFQYSEDGAICLCMHALYEPVSLHSHQSEHSMCYCFKYCICKIQNYHKRKTYKIRQSVCICAQ